MKTVITDPARTYLLVSGGDGYETAMATGDKLENAYLSLFYTDAKNCPFNEHEAFLESLYDEDNWTINYMLGPVRYSEIFEDGSVDVILLSASDTPQKALAALVNVARAAFYAADDSEEIEGDDGRELRVSSNNFDALSDALDALDDLPDDRPDYVMNGPARAEWALRELFPTEPESLNKEAA